MPDYPYDPDFPFVVVRLKSLDEYPVNIAEARFREKIEANHYQSDFAEGWAEVIDTTPKPKIPGDAEYITWYDENNQRQIVAFCFGHPGNDVWRMPSGLLVGKTDLIAAIGDAEITVLDERK